MFVSGSYSFSVIQVAVVYMQQVMLCGVITRSDKWIRHQKGRGKEFDEQNLKKW